MSNSSTPVSYTHLDVYKRQGEIVEAVGGKVENAVGRQFDFETRYGNKIRAWELVK